MDSPLDLLIARFTRIPIFPLVILFSVIGLAIGAFLVISPGLSIEMQKRFYYRINWRMEPVSLSKEIRHTRVMGWLLIVFLAATLIFVFVNPL